MIRTTTCAALLLLPVGAAAQGFSFAPFTAVDRGLDGSPQMVGLAATTWAGPFGLRVSGSMDLESSPIAPIVGAPPTEATRAWAADLDLIIPGRALGLDVGIEPSAFVGFGVHGQRDVRGEPATIPAWSYGLGASLPVVDWLSIDGDARYRMPHESDADRLPAGVEGGWELRVGAALHFGRSRASRPTVARRPQGRRTIRLGGRYPATPAPTRPTGTPSGRGASAAALAERTLDTADDYLGVPYTWGGNTPAEGFDCSGFVRYVFARNGIDLPRVSRDQARAGRWVRPVVPALLPGDLMFYAGSDGVVNHVAIYAGDNRIIHSSSSGRGVKYDDLSSRRGRYYATRMVAARRVIPEGDVFFLPLR